MGEVIFGPEREYVVIMEGLELLAFGPSANEEIFLKWHANDLKRKELETAKHTIHYKGEDIKIIFYQDLRTGKYDYTLTKPKEGKGVYCGDLSGAISFLEKGEKKLDSEKIAYEDAIKALKTSNKK